MSADNRHMKVLSNSIVSQVPKQQFVAAQMDFFLISSLRPVVVEPMEQLDDEDGFSEPAFTKKTPEFSKEREVLHSKN